IARSRSASMNRIASFRPWTLAIVCCAAAVVVLPGVARGQGDLIGSRGGQVPPAALLPSSAGSVGSMLQGLNRGGASVQNGLGPNVSTLTQNGVRGQQLASMIHD